MRITVEEEEEEGMRGKRERWGGGKLPESKARKRKWTNKNCQEANWESRDSNLSWLHKIIFN